MSGILREAVVVTLLVQPTALQAQPVIFQDDFEYGDPGAWSLVVPSWPAGESCSTPANVSWRTFPHQLPGTFTDDPATGGSCDIVPNNVAWFAYTPMVSGDHQIALTNHTSTTAYSRLAVFETRACEPYGPEIECVTSNDQSVATSVALTAGTPYLIPFYTDGEAYTMVDPEIVIQPLGLGHSCSYPADVSTASFPLELLGTFDDDPTAGGSCDLTPTNGAWFSYTPNITGTHRLTLVNHTATSAFSRAAVFSGSNCSPYGPELACQTASSATVSLLASLTAATTHLILFHTDGEAYTMVDPSIDIAPPEPGQECIYPADVSAVSFPYQLSGTFDLDPGQGGSCDLTPTNAVWFEYTPATSGSYAITLVNHTATSAWSRAAVFSGSGCSPYGTELACQTSSAQTVLLTATLSSGTPHLIVFYTDGNDYTMVDPEVTIVEDF